MNIIVPIGLPGSGKTEYGKLTYVKKDDIIIDADSFYKEGKSLDDIFKYIESLIITPYYLKYLKSVFTAGSYNIYLDGLFVTPTAQEKIIDWVDEIAGTHRGILTFIVFKGPIDYCIYNDLQRSKLTGRASSTSTIKNTKIQISKRIKVGNKLNVEKYDGIQYFISRYNLKYYQSSYWCVGGTYGTCWDEDGPSECSVDEPLDIKEYDCFIDVLKAFNVQDKFDTYADLFVYIDVEHEWDYYGGCQENARYCFGMRKLIKQILMDKYNMYSFDMDDLKTQCPELLI